MDELGMNSTAFLVGAVLALITTILVFALVMPRKKDGKLGSDFLQFLHDLFHFKQLYLGTILKFIYALLTFAALFGGFISFLIALSNAIQNNLWMPVLISLGIMLLGPVLLRIAYECLMMGVLLVQNVLDINHKLKAEAKPRSKERRTAQRSEFAPPVQVVRAVFCPRCGSKFDASLAACPTCGRANVQ